MKEEWTVPEHWALEVERAIGRFVSESRITKKRLAQALNMDPSCLSLSHLEDPAHNRYLYHRLIYAVRGDQLFDIGRRLCLDFKGFQSLQRLAGQLLEVSTGYRIGAVRVLEGTREASELGITGVENFDREDWETAGPYMQHSWAYFSEQKLLSEGSLAYELLYIGTSLISWHSTNGGSGEAIDIANKLLPLSRIFEPKDAKEMKAKGYFYRALGIAQRHSTWHPDIVIQAFQKAQAILHDYPAGIKGANLRDQAKPYTLWGLKEEDKRNEYFDRAKKVLEGAECLFDSNAADSPEQEDWILTRLARIECLAAMGEDQEVLRLWDATMEHPRVQEAASGPEASRLYAKWVFASLAVRFARQDFDSMAAIAYSFAADPRNTRHGERVLRAQNMVSLAEQRDKRELRWLLVR